MKFARCAILGLSLTGLLSSCSDTETTLSVNVRYWTDYLNSASFMLKIEQDGRTAIEEPIVPRDLGDGKFDVVCDHDWEKPYCRFYKRFDLTGWSESDVTVTLSGTTVDGKDIATEMADRGITDKLSDMFELEANEVNVVYIQLPNVNSPAATVAPDMTSDLSGSSAFDAGVVEAGVSSGAPTDAGVPDASVPDANGVDAATVEAGTPERDTDSGSTDGGLVDASVTDAGGMDAATDAAPVDASDAN